SGTAGTADRRIPTDDHRHRARRLCAQRLSRSADRPSSGHHRGRDLLASGGSPMNTSSGKKPRTNELADRIAGFDDPSMGDEREREVILRAYTFGSIVSTYVFFALGVIFAVIGGGMWTALIVLASGVSGMAVSAHCQRENLDVSPAMARVSPHRPLNPYLPGARFPISWGPAFVFQQTPGPPLLHLRPGRGLSGLTKSTSIAIGAA